MTQDSPRGTRHRTTDTGAIPRVRILGVGVHRIDMPEAVEISRRFIESGKPHIVVTADASAIVLAQRDQGFRDLVNRADLVTPDGAGILLGAKWLGTPLKERVSGVDMARELCRMAAEDGFSVFLFGAAQGVADAAAERLKAGYPGLRIAGTRHGFFSEADSPEIVREIKDSGAKALLVALGIPKQEKWIAGHLDELGVCLAIGVGGSFDVFSGKVKRAPVWMQRHGLEWLYRLARNPRKMSKVATLPRFVALVLRERLRASGRKPSPEV